VLVIHTDTKGNITESELPDLREAARNIDKNKYEAIVSVMMLKEGWDVKSVVVIVPLRPATAPTLPEQILGRGLRRMEPFNAEWRETLVVVDHPRFRELWDAEIRKGELYAKIESVKVKPTIHSIMVDASKLGYDFEIPMVEGGITSRVPEISKLDVEVLPSHVFKLSEIEPPKVMWREKDLLTQKIVEEKELAFSYVDTLDDYLSYITKAVIAKSKIPSYFFPELVPKVEEYIIKFLFADTFDINNREEIVKLNLPPIRRTLVESFNKEILKLAFREEETYVISQYKLSSTPVLHTSKSEDMLYAPNKCIFNILPADSGFEIEFMRYLDSQSEVLAFTKVLRYWIPLHIRYYDHYGYLRYYIPDFIVKTENCFYLIETKGEEDINVRYKDRAATEWCKATTKGTGFPWKYVKIMSKDFEENSSLILSQLVRDIGYSQFTLNDIQ
jgi:type III restriction enzyme